MRKNHTLLLLIAALLLAAAVLAACGAAAAPTQAPSQPAGGATTAPAADGAQLLKDRCGGCHRSNVVEGQKLSPEAWDQLVTRMVGKGAKLTDAEKAALVDYLAQTYRP